MFDGSAHFANRFDASAAPAVIEDTSLTAVTDKFTVHTPFAPFVTWNNKKTSAFISITFSLAKRILTVPRYLMNQNEMGVCTTSRDKHCSVKSKGHCLLFVEQSRIPHWRTKHAENWKEWSFWPKKVEKYIIQLYSLPLKVISRIKIMLAKVWK